MQTARWNNHTFTVSPQVIRGFTGLSVKGSSETEEMESGDQYHIARKAGKPAEVSLTALLNAATGCKVREEAMAFVTDARAGAANYFYVGGKKLMTCQLMLIDASVDEVQINPRGIWTSAQVKLTLKQCGGNAGGFGGGTPVNGKDDGGGGGSGGGKGNGSNKTSVNTMSAATRARMAAKNKSKKGKEKRPAVRSAVNTINNIVNRAKAASKKSGGTPRRGGGGGGMGGRSSAVMMVR